LEMRQPIKFHAETQPNRSFWDEISKWTRVSLREPSIVLKVLGSLESPKGSIAVNVASLELPSRFAEGKLPRLDKLTANLEIVPGRLRLHDFQVFVAEQPIHVTGELPFNNDFSKPLKEVADFKNATARVQIDHALVAPFVSLSPKLISPQGELSLDLKV